MLRKLVVLVMCAGILLPVLSSADDVALVSPVLQELTRLAGNQVDKPSLDSGVPDPSFWLLFKYSSCEVRVRDRVLNYANLTKVSGGTASGSGFCRFPVLDSAKAERRQAESRFRSPGCHQPQPMCSWFTLFTASFVFICSL